MQGRLLVWAIKRRGLALKFVNGLLRCDFYARVVGDNLYVPHPIGVVVHSSAKIGDGVTIFQGVTIGVTRDGESPPTIGNGVLLGAGCVVLGRITIGEKARVGANAVVVSDVPPGATVVGVPARCVG